jgi:hypothetical protein
MSIEHPEPTSATIKELYGTAYCCAHPQCSRPLYKVDSDTGQGTLNSRVAHIRARRENGPRWNPSQTPDKNRSRENLLLLCIEHSYEIDDHNGSNQFTPETLQKWKTQQLNDFDALSNREAEEAAQASFYPSSIAIHNSVMNLGGEGGKAPGAGGGGGGVIGNGGRGGAGGTGGNIINYGFIDLKGSPDEVPGTGGGGGGATGEGGIGGEGGGGGDIVTAWFRLADLPDSVEIVVGQGGRANAPNGDGEDGGDSRFGDFLVAKGGKGGRSGRNQQSGRHVVTADLEQGLRISAIHLAHCIYQHHGFLDLLSADWGSIELPSLPHEVQLPLACTVSLGQLEPGSEIEFETVILDPNGTKIFKQGFTVVRQINDQSKVVLVHHATNLQFIVSIAGVWHITIVSGGIELARLPIEMRLSIR